jgi:hypothetical protein
MRVPPFHDASVLIDGDLRLRRNARLRFLTAHLAFRDEIFVGANARRHDQDDQTKSKGR